MSARIARSLPWVLCAVAATTRAAAQELPGIDAASVTLLQTAGELQRSDFAVIPRDEPLTDGVRPACSPMWQLAFSLQRHLIQHLVVFRPEESWQSWVAHAEGLEHLGDSSDGTFLTSVRQEYRVGYLVLIALRETPSGAELEVETVDGYGNSVRRGLTLPLGAGVTRTTLPSSELRCLDETQRAESVETLVTAFTARPEVRSQIGATTVVWLQPDTLRGASPGCDRNRVLHERVTRQLPGGAGLGLSFGYLRGVAPDPLSAATRVLAEAPQARTVLVLRRVGESPGGVMMSAELWSREGLVGRTVNSEINPPSWHAMEARLRCDDAPSRSFAVRADPSLAASGIDYHEHPRSWVLYLQGHVGGALRTVDGDDGRTAFGGSLRLDVATATDDALVHLGVGAGLSTDSVGWAQALVSLRAGSFFRAGLGAGATASLRGDFALTDGMVSANVVILAPLFPGVRSAGGTLSVEAFKGFTTPLAYLTISLGLWFGRP